MLTAKNQDQLRNPTLGNRVWATFFKLRRHSWHICFVYICLSESWSDLFDILVSGQSLTLRHVFSQFSLRPVMPSVLRRCWLGGRKGIRPVKHRAVGCWCGSLLEQGADLHMAHLIPLPLTVSCFSKIQIGFTFLVPAYLGSPGKRAVKCVCVCVCVCVCMYV